MCAYDNDLRMDPCEISVAMYIDEYFFLDDYYIKKYSNPITSLDRPGGFQEFEAPRFQDNRHMKVIRLSALRTGRFYPQEIFPVLISVKAESTPGP